MTVEGWGGFFIIAFVIWVGVWTIFNIVDKNSTKAIFIIIGIIATAAVLFGFRWYFTNTESGKRALVTQQSELGEGLQRTITVYTADGEVIAEYEGKIDIQSEDGGYVLFDLDGKRYTYYNCFVESIAEIE